MSIIESTFLEQGLIEEFESCSSHEIIGREPGPTRDRRYCFCRVSVPKYHGLSLWPCQNYSNSSTKLRKLIWLRGYHVVEGEIRAFLFLRVNDMVEL